MATRDLTVLVAREGLSITRASCAAGTRITRPHVHHEHTDAFFVLEGELTFELGPDFTPVTIPAGELVAVPPNVVHSFHNAGDQPARWLTIHAPDGGFAAFVRGIDTDWDVSSA